MSLREDRSMDLEGPQCVFSFTDRLLVVTGLQDFLDTRRRIASRPIG